MHRSGWKLAVLAQLLSCICRAQDVTAGALVPNAGFTVRLDLHEGKSKFLIGDPVLVDLIFVDGAPGYSVDTNMYTYLPPHDIIYVAPDDGWVRTHQAGTGGVLIGNGLVALGSEPVRVPVLLNRTIGFENPGHYEISVASERLRVTSSLQRVASIEDCDPCAATNTIGIDISRVMRQRNQPS